jgi:hypothetical protein
MAILRALGGHEFWSDGITLVDSQRIDTYLLALALAHGGKLATFDRHLVTGAVINGSKALHLVS